MRYAEYRNNIRSGDILAWTHRGIKSLYDLKTAIVKTVTRSDYVHVGIAWTYHGRVFVLEATPPLVRVVPLSNLLPCYVLHMNRGFSPEAENKAFQHVGSTKYSTVDAILSLIGINLTEGMQCVEYTKEVLSANRIHFDCRNIPSEFIIEAQKLATGTVYVE